MSYKLITTCNLNVEMKHFFYIYYLHLFTYTYTLLSKANNKIIYRISVKFQTEYWNNKLAKVQNSKEGFYFCNILNQNVACLYTETQILAHYQY